MGIVKSLFPRSGKREDEVHEEAPIEAQATTQLFMLTPDAVGIAAHQVQRFSAAMAAEVYLDSTMRGEVREGTILFWGMSWYPGHGDDGAIEPVVLINDLRRVSQVYTFSFTDLNSAYDFVRHEMKAGLDLAQVSVYWALPAKINIDFWGRAGITPQEPPRRAGPREAATVAEPAAAEAAIEEAPAAPVEAAPRKRVPTNPALPPEISGSALGEADLAHVARIFSAKGIGRVTNGNGKATAEPPARPVAPEADEMKPVENETLNVQLSDVYGQPMRVVRRTNRDALSHLGGFGRGHETPEMFRAEGEPATVKEIKAPPADEPVSGTVQAWSNIAEAMDWAIDAHIACRVVATITWRRLSRALAEAAEASDAARSRAAWRNGADALAVAAKVVDARRQARRSAWQNSARALREAGVAEAQLRIAQASLDEQLLKEVKEAITRVKGEQVAEALIEAPDLARVVEAVEVAPVVAAEMPTVKAEPKAEPRRSKGTKASKNGTRKAKGDEAEKVAAEAAKDEVAQPEPPPAAEVEELVDDHAAIEMWRFRETSRFRAKDEAFKGFASPPGRF